VSDTLYGIDFDFLSPMVNSVTRVMYLDNTSVIIPHMVGMSPKRDGTHITADLKVAQESENAIMYIYITQQHHHHNKQHVY
jgi:hypothetical protein